MRVFITGGTGFIGRRVVAELQSKGDDILMLSRQPENALSMARGVKMAPGNLADIFKWRNTVKAFKPQAAIHLAWEALPDYSAATSIKNLNYGFKLTSFLAESGCETVICAGSCFEYGQQNGKLAEDTPLKPNNAFTAAKNSLHWLGKEIAKEHNMNFIWTRFFYVYGPGQRQTSLIPHIIDSVRKRKNPEIKTPQNKNDFVYVDDVASAVCAIVRRPLPYAVYNIGSGVSTSVGEIADIVCNRFNFPIQHATPNSSANSTVVDFRADITKIGSDTGWQPETGIENGIRKTIDYYLNSP